MGHMGRMGRMGRTGRFPSTITVFPSTITVQALVQEHKVQGAAAPWQQERMAAGVVGVGSEVVAAGSGAVVDSTRRAKM